MSLHGRWKVEMNLQEGYAHLPFFILSSTLIDRYNARGQLYHEGARIALDMGVLMAGSDLGNIFSKPSLRICKLFF